MARVSSLSAVAAAATTTRSGRAKTVSGQARRSGTFFRSTSDRSLLIRTFQPTAKLIKLSKNDAPTQAKRRRKLVPPT